MFFVIKEETMQSTKRQKKVSITQGISEKVAKSKSITVTDYRGLNTSQLLALRQKLANLSAEYQITKNTLLRRALESNGLEVPSDLTDGPSATLFSYEDEIAPLRALSVFAKTTKLPTIKGGFLDKDFLSAKKVEALAELPSKEALIAQLLGTVQAPTANLVFVLQANIRNLVYALAAIKDTKSA